MYTFNSLSHFIVSVNFLQKLNILSQQAFLVFQFFSAASFFSFDHYTVRDYCFAGDLIWLRNNS